MNPTDPTPHAPPRRTRLRAGGLAVIATLLLTTGLLTACDNTAVVLEGNVTYSSGLVATRAVDPNKPLAPGVSVKLFSDDTETEVAATTTNLVGHYAFHTSTVADGTYRLLVGDQWYGGSSWNEATSLQLGAAESQIVDIDLLWTGSVSGQIVDSSFAGLADVAIWATDASGTIVATTMSGTGGWYTLGIPDDGTYTVTIKGTGDPVDIGGATATEFVVGSGADDHDTGQIDLATGLAPVAPWSATATVTGATAAGGLQLQVAGTGFTDLPNASTGAPAAGVYVGVRDVTLTNADINADTSLALGVMPISKNSFGPGGTFTYNPTIPAAALDPEADYEVFVWVAHGNITDTTLLAEAPITLTAEQHQALFPAYYAPQATVTVTGASAAGGLQLRVDGVRFTDLPNASTGAPAAGVYVGVRDATVTNAEVNADNSLALNVTPISKGSFPAGTFTHDTTIPVSSLDPTVDYEVFIWVSHGNITDSTFLGEFPVTLTAEQHEALFG